MLDAIYIHIPFCVKKCDYCDFLSFKSTKEERKKYVDFILKEIELYPKYNYNTVYFGGGTPSLLEPSDVKRILSKLNINENAEVTLEANPKTVDYEKLKGFKEAGINRLSMGIQSFNEKFLKKLGRLHSSHEGEEAYFTARKAGFNNISLDLMFSLPEQTLDEVREDLEKMVSLNPEHFSIYSLIWEPDTKFFEKLEKGEYKETDNDLEASMYEMIIDYSTKMGYEHYEISNFCKKGKEAQHNSKYWRNEEYVGIGIGASGYIDGIRYKNKMKFTDYYDSILIGKKPVLEVEEVNEEMKEEYRHILGLRLLQEGIIPSSTEKYLEIYKELEKDGFIEKKLGRYILTRKGIFLANDVFEKLI
ncbi:radical SAM family heme chaperone HemW [Fusobacterium sp.]|uniref:radical SAM family heme chaperone HemW n=1 Tax=Fusobacterium sp. TaxID=68766 RepID=UPI00263681AD|nr:radical SAM family heme chaperone HemW [Fusobacterium sp.]